MTAYVLFVLLLLPLTAVAGWWATHRQQSRVRNTTLHARDMLHRDAQAMYLRLRTALPQYLIFARANLNAFVEVRGSSRSAVLARQAELARQSADFLICGADFHVVAAVELEDVVTGRRAPAQSAALMRAAEIPVLRWTTVNLPTIRDIQEAVAEIEAARLLRIGMKKHSPNGASRDLAATRRDWREPRL
ncbi:MAG TPA: DUF2726 domain-containing protein [Gammaproteobacteria bacterium]|nr:DUF2726 domain-containing protein [Gammaproteobacteria bacterium]